MLTFANRIMKEKLDTNNLGISAFPEEENAEKALKIYGETSWETKWPS